MIELTKEQHESLQEAEENPPCVLDPQSATTYVLLKKDAFERIRHMIEDDSDEPQWAAFLEAAGEEWDDPAMDVYEQYRKQR